MEKGLEEGRLKSYIVMMTRILNIICQTRIQGKAYHHPPYKKIKIVNGGIEIEKVRAR